MQLLVEVPSPVSSTDRVPVFETDDVGAIPARGTNNGVSSNGRTGVFEAPYFGSNPNVPSIIRSHLTVGCEVLSFVI